MFSFGKMEATLDEATTVCSGMDNMEIDCVNHPLFNLVVLKNIFSHCTREDLANCRLVCKTFENACLSAWRELAIATVDRSIFYGHKNCSEIPFRSSKFSKYSLTGELLRTGDYWLNICFRFSKEWMTHLQLTNCSIDYMAKNSLKDLLYRSTPNLQTLVLEKFRMLPDVRPQPDPNPVKQISLEDVKYEQRNMKRLEIGLSELQLPLKLIDIFRIYPCLEHIRVYAAPDSDPMTTAQLFGLFLLSDLRKIRQEDWKKLNLKTLDLIGVKRGVDTKQFFGDIDSKLSNKFQEMNLPLECLTIDLPKEMQFDVIQDIISQHSKTLKKLDIYRRPECPPFPQFPSKLPLKFLTILRMQENLVKDFTFLKFCPNLKILHICEVEEVSWTRRGKTAKTTLINETTLGDMEGVRIESVKELRFDYKCNAYEIGLLSEWMPNVRRLIMMFSNETLCVACQKWEKLEDLAVLQNPIGVNRQNIGANMGMLQSCLKNLKNFHVIGDPSQLGHLDSTGFRMYTKNITDIFEQLELFNGFNIRAQDGQLVLAPG